MNWRRVLSWETPEEQAAQQLTLPEGMELTQLTPGEIAALVKANAMGETFPSRAYSEEEREFAKNLDHALGKLQLADDATVLRYPVYWSGYVSGTSYISARNSSEAAFLARSGFDDSFESNDPGDWEFSEVGEP